MEDNITLLAAAKYEKDLCKKLFDKNGKIKITDLALLSGAVVNNNVEYYIWTKSGDNDNGVVVLKVPFENNNWSHNTIEFNSYRRGATILPTITSPDVFNDVISRNNNDKDYFEVEFGEYPQYVPNRKLQTRLLGALLHGEMSGTGKTYTFDSVIRDDYPKPFNPKIYDEYEYEGRRFIYYESKNKYGKNVIYPGMRLKNGMEYDIFDKFFVEVLPVKWIVDKKHQRLVCKSCLLSGIPFTDTKEYDGIGAFLETSIKKYMEQYMFRDIMQNVYTYSLNSSMSKVRSLNGLNFDKVSEEDIIRGAIESGIAVFLHGRSSEGKSARVKEIDPTCEIIYLRNATPESLNGKSVYKESTGEMIDIKPTWLKRLEEKCVNEPEKFHIVFFDEVTNALPSIQGMAFNIVLDREVNGMWKLPENARIVAAGNDMNDSLAANQLAEPLFNRFSHVYIKTTKDNWLKWAIENNIHPAIVSYIAYKGEKVLRTEYNGETPNADPRKWEMASKMLYATRNPEMLRSLVGEDITKEFIAFCKQRVITLSDVLNDNYTIDDIKKLNTSERFATITGLTCVNDDNLEKVRKFTTKIGLEYTALFDSLWSHGDPKRLERLAELSLDEEIDLEQKKFIDKIELSLLSTKQVNGLDDKGRLLSDGLDVMEKYGYVAAMTDLAILTGGNPSENNGLRVKDDKSIRGRTCCYLTLTPDGDGDLRTISATGIVRRRLCTSRSGIIRPVISKSSGIWGEAYDRKKEGYDHMYEAEFGEYPQYVPEYSTQKKLEKEYQNNRLLSTGRTYTFDNVKIQSSADSFTPVTYDEYEYNGKKYIRVKNNSGYYELSNGYYYNDGDFVWVEVSPVIWFIDYQKELLISKRGLLSGIRFDNQNGCYKGDFTKTELYEYMNTYMKHDLFQGESLKYVEEKSRKLIKK